MKRKRLRIGDRVCMVYTTHLLNKGVRGTLVWHSHGQWYVSWDGVKVKGYPDGYEMYADRNDIDFVSRK